MDNNLTVSQLLERLIELGYDDCLYTKTRLTSSWYTVNKYYRTTKKLMGGVQLTRGKIYGIGRGYRPSQLAKLIIAHGEIPIIEEEAKALIMLQELSK